MAYNLVVDGAITNAQINNGQLEFNPNGTFSKYFKIFGSITNIALDSDGYFIVSPNGTFADYAIIGDRLTDVPLTSTGAIINPTRLYKYFRPFSNLATYQNPSDFLVRYKLDGTDSSLTRTGGDDFRKGKASPDTKASGFNGSTQYYTSSDSSIIQNTEALFSISFWINSIASSKQVIQFGTNTAAGTGFSIDITAGGLIGLTSNGTTINSTTAINNGKEYFITFVYNGTNLLIYINGTLETTSALTPNTFTSSTFYLGWDGTTGFFSGLLDDFRYYNRVISAGEITALNNYTNDWNDTHSTAFEIFNSSRLDKITKSGASVSSWVGLKGNLNLSQAVAINQPQWSNGYIQMVGGGQNMLTTNNAGINGNFTIFEVVTYADVTESCNTLSTTAGSYLRNSATGNTRNSWSTSPTNGTFAMSNGNVSVIAHRVNSGVRAEGWINGSLDIVFTDNVNARTVDNVLKMNNSSFVQTVTIYGYVVYQSYISDEELDKVFGLIHWQLGKQNLLPSDHPYKNNPPRV